MGGTQTAGNGGASALVIGRQLAQRPLVGHGELGAAQLFDGSMCRLGCCEHMHGPTIPHSNNLWMPEAGCCTCCDPCAPGWSRSEQAAAWPAHL